MVGAGTGESRVGTNETSLKPGRAWRREDLCSKGWGKETWGAAGQRMGSLWLQYRRGVPDFCERNFQINALGWGHCDGWQVVADERKWRDRRAITEQHKALHDEKLWPRPNDIKSGDEL